MPVLSASQHVVPHCTMGLPRFLIALGLLLSIGLVLFRIRSAVLRDRSQTISTEERGHLPEKTEETEQETGHAIARSSRTSPLVSENAPLMPASMDGNELNMTSPTSANFSYYDAPVTEEPTPLVSAGFAEPEAVVSSINFVEAMDIPRRRSYTKQTSQGGSISEVSGEIVTADGWRRHTRVFGGGVCEACVESERRMTS